MCRKKFRILGRKWRENLLFVVNKIHPEFAICPHFTKFFVRNSYVLPAAVMDCIRHATVINSQFVLHNHTCMMGIPKSMGARV